MQGNDFCLTKIISNQIIVTGSGNGDLKIWNISFEYCLKTMKEHHFFIFDDEYYFFFFYPFEVFRRKFFLH